MNKQKAAFRRRLAAWLMAMIMAAAVFPLSAFSAGEDDAPTEAEASEQPMVNIIETPTAEGTETESAEPAPESADEETEPESGTEQEPEPASEEPDVETDGDPAVFTVFYYSGATLLSQETVEAGKTPVNVPASVSGSVIAAWTDGAGTAVSVSSTVVSADVSYYAVPMPRLETERHIRYINGDGTGNFNPGSSLTRAQAAMILSTLLKTDEPGPISTAFSDVPDGRWYSDAIRLLASYGIISGYSQPDGTYTFRPNSSVTRAEFVTMLIRATGAVGSGSVFTDVSASHWARTQIEAAAANGWISGYEEADGSHTFRPQRAISRAEAVTVVNNALGRRADIQQLTDKGSVTIFFDVSPSAWYYGAVMEASVEHEYQITSSGEQWTNYDPQSIGLAPGIYLSDGRWYMIGADGLPVFMKAGINEVDGKFYYAEVAGSYFTGDLSRKAGYCVFSDGSEKALADDLNLIGSTLFCWNISTASARKLSAGPNVIDGTTYWADEDGYVIRNDFFAGVVELGGKKYLSRGYCDIVTSGLGYTGTTSKPTNIDLKEQTYEYDGNMYYLKSDYSLACDEWVGYLYFGEDCAYTSGDAEIDTYVWNVVKDFIGNTALTKEQKLLRAYYYIRGGQGSTYAASPFRYRNLQISYARGRYNEQTNYSWIISSAKYMFTQKAGMCYEWASVYLFMARRLGFQAYIVVGGVFQESTRHCWCMIQWDGYWHISDVEIEWGYMAGWYSSQPVYRNLFAQTVSNEHFSTYKNPECALTYWAWE